MQRKTLGFVFFAGQLGINEHMAAVARYRHVESAFAVAVDGVDFPDFDQVAGGLQATVYFLVKQVVFFLGLVVKTHQQVELAVEQDKILVVEFFAAVFEFVRFGALEFAVDIVVFKKHLAAGVRVVAFAANGVKAACAGGDDFVNIGAGGFLELVAPDDLSG